MNIFVIGMVLVIGMGLWKLRSEEESKRDYSSWVISGILVAAIGYVAAKGIPSFMGEEPYLTEPFSGLET